MYIHDEQRNVPLTKWETFDKTIYYDHLPYFVSSYVFLSDHITI